ncbi:hypothetical protein [Brevibacillus borstelensis]|uniref:hypothetical protein n=1 Tax=Brevibacillus borstelensis TaxID=45462 RepID=UPI0030C63DCF
MAKRTTPPKSDPFSAEFLAWLKEKNVSRRRLQKNSALYDQYYQEWSKEKKKNRPRRRSLFKLPNINIDFGAILNGMQIASEVMRTFQGSLLNHSSKNDD